MAFRKYSHVSHSPPAMKATNREITAAAPMASRLMLRASIVKACGPCGVVTMNARGLSTRRASHRLPPRSAKTATPDSTVSSARAASDLTKTCP